LRWFTEQARQGFFATDQQYRVLVWNRWMEIHSGIAAADIVGRSIFEIYPDAVQRGICDYYTSALTGQVTIVSHGLHRHVLPFRPTNPDLHFDVMPQSGQIGPLIHDDAIIGTVTVLEDVSERLATEAQLRTQIEAHQAARGVAERAVRAKDEFLSTLSHEMRTPLNAVLGWAKILLARSEIEPELLDRALHVIERNASAQAKLIDDLLDMSRVMSGKLRLETQPVDLLSVVIAAVDVIMPAASAKKIAILTSFDRGSLRVMGDPDRLQQVVWNLLSNAMKFTEAGGAITVKLEAAGTLARIVVSDTGPGISEEFLPHVFERFRQDDASSARRYGGLGLGLALVRELVQLHGGTVRAANGVATSGATFTIELPLARLPALESARQTPELPFAAPSLAGVRVLVVDDEPDSREIAVRVLEECGAIVTQVSSSAAAIEGLRVSPFDALPHVIVSDIGMPSEDGYDLIRHVRRLAMDRGGQIPAIAVSGYATPEDVKQAYTAGYQVHVPKPMNSADLILAIHALTRGNR
jgi:signal transduction histidine kinase/ActR/RegA family two-component response regulator